MRQWYFSFCMGGCLVYTGIFRSVRVAVWCTLVFFTLYGWLSGLQWYFSFCKGDYLVYTDLFHCVWVAVWSAAADHTATHTQ